MPSRYCGYIDIELACFTSELLPRCNDANAVGVAREETRQTQPLTSCESTRVCRVDFHEHSQPLGCVRKPTRTNCSLRLLRSRPPRPQRVEHWKVERHVRPGHG